MHTNFQSQRLEQVIDIISTQIQSRVSRVQEYSTSLGAAPCMRHAKLRGSDVVRAALNLDLLLDLSGIRHYHNSVDKIYTCSAILASYERGTMFDANRCNCKKRQA